MDAFGGIENHPLEGFVIAGGWSNSLPLERIAKGEGDGGLVVGRDNCRRISSARRLP